MFKLLLPTILAAQAFAQQCDMCWDGSYPSFDGQTCAPCPLQDKPTSPAGCDQEIIDFCDNVKGVFDVQNCACYIEYLPENEDTQESDPPVPDTTPSEPSTTPTEPDTTSNEQDTTADEPDTTPTEPVDQTEDGGNSGPVPNEDGLMPWEVDNDDYELLPTNEVPIDRKKLKGKYVQFALWNVVLTVAATWRFTDIWYWYWMDSEEVALVLTGILALYSMFRLEIYMIEWLMRYFGYAGRIANWLAYFTLKYYYFNLVGVGAVAGTYVFLYYDERWWTEFEYIGMGLFAGWVAGLLVYRQDVMGYLKLLQKEFYSPLIDWTFWSDDEVTTDGMVVINEENFNDYKEHARRRQNML